MKWQDQVCRIAETPQTQLGWAVLTEPHRQLFATMLKPDFNASKNGSINVIEGQFVYTGQTLDASYRPKVSV